MRLLFLSLWCCVFASGCAFPKRKPLYLAPGFSPRQIEVITVLQPLDLRYDRSLKTNFVEVIEKVAGRLLKNRDYHAELNLDPDWVAHVSEGDFENPSSDWIRNLGPKDAHWIMLLSVEYVTHIRKPEPQTVAELRGVLFEKDSGTEVWRGVGKGHMHAGTMFGGAADKEAVRKAAFDLFFGLPRKKDDLADYRSLEDPNVPLDYEKETLPSVGMSNTEIKELFGETENIVSHDRGETWYYHLNPGEGYLRFVTATYRPKIWVFQFDKEGSLTKFHFTDRRISGIPQGK